MKKLLSLFVLAMMVLVLAACGGGNDDATEGSGDEGEGSGETKTIRAGIGLNDSHPQYLALLEWKKLVEERTDGAIEVETYHSSQLGDDRSMTEALQLGSQEVTIPSTAPIANFVPEYSVFDFPFLFPNAEVADKVLDGEVGHKFLDMLEEQNLVGLAYWENGFRDITNNERPIESASDFSGLKLRTMENELHLDAFKALGANPTPMAFGELFTAMQQGTVDGQENPIPTIYLQGFYEVQEFVSATNHIYSPFVFLMSKDFFDGLTEEQQTIVTEAAVEAGALNRELNREATAQNVEDLKEEGMTYNELTPEARAEMIEIIQPVLDEYAEKIGAETVQEVYDAIEAAEAE
ncbi:TRAP transporter substrate-binding protein [Planococcus sp. X10-3]|uniref:TRAP transporter substrate-binding protein n=1 Tax=Planococcus sp. X10-3 TaxID=3061240 RepID=UPI003BAF5A5A